MAYVPKNTEIFVAAFSGAMAGMCASLRVISDTVSADYAAYASIAGAWAQSYDTQRGSSNATTLEVELANDMSKAVWEGRDPTGVVNNTTPATFTAECTAILAAITAGIAFFTAQGVVSPSSDLILFGFWGANVVHGASPFSPPASRQMVPVDTTGGTVTVRTPLANDGASLPLDGQVFLVKDVTGNAGITPIVIAANGGGVTVENPNAPGTFGANGAITVQGSCVGFKYRASDSKWIGFLGF